MIPRTLRIFFGLLAGAAPLPAATTILFGPQLYFSEEDSPFIGGIRAGIIFLEDFEDQVLNTPNVREPTGLGYIGTTYRQGVPNVAHGLVWSVDGDDGFIDGSGFSGDTWITTNSSSFTPAGRMRFEFVPDILGRYPTFVGIVITGVLDVDDTVDLAFNDPTGRNVISDGEFDPKDWNPPGGAAGGDPRTHRFIGVYNEDGIASLGISNVWQVDHLQYGYAIPEPGPWWLVLTATGLLLRRRRSLQRTGA